MSSDFSRPFFSVLIPSYNRPEDIVRNIDSVLAGEFKKFEIIISDDKSPRQVEISRAVAPYLKNKNIKFFQQNRNLREPANKNFLIEKAVGDYNIMLGDDDRLYPNALSILKKYIDENPGFDIYGFGYTIVDEYDNKLTSYQARELIEIEANNSDLIKEVFKAGALPLWIFHTATFCCKRGIELDLPYKTDVGMAEDMWFIFEALAHQKRICVIPELLFFWRKIQDIKVGQQINQSLIPLANVAARILMYEKIQELKASMPSGLFSYLDSKAYRQKFIYDAIVSETGICRNNYYDLALGSDFQSELLEYTRGPQIPILRNTSNLKKAFSLMKALGAGHGLALFSRLFYQKVIYRIRMTFSRAQ